MKRVGIVSCYFKDNYGSMLQAYATKKVLDNNGILNETINIEKNLDFKKGKRKYYKSQLLNFKFIKAKFGMIKLKIDKKINKELEKDITIRNNKYREFKKEFNLSMACTSYKDLKELAKKKYTDVIVGSDQLWLPVNVVADYYTLNWVPNDINKISYATSFGFSSLPNKYYKKYEIFLKRINHLSVREQSGVKIIKDVTGLDAELVADPTILLTKEEWEKEATKEKIFDEKYILCYFLGNNIEHRKFAERLKETTGCKIVSLNHADEYVKYSDKFCDYAPYDIGPREWINLIKNAEYVCTDSFHGTVFSILFNKIFFDFRRHSNKSKVSTNSRIDSLLNVAGINVNRILTGRENIEDVLKYEIDYEKVNQNMNMFREKSKKWLLDSITWNEKEKGCINIQDKSECCGCTACKSICPNNAIEMTEDEEGFLYPKVNEEKCIKCGLCKRVCPILNKKKNQYKFIQKAFVLNNKDLEIRKQSTSGGSFTPIAKYVIKMGGVVFGATKDKSNMVYHTWTRMESELEQFRGSKYVQSEIKDCYTKVKEFLDNNEWVCFSGTPCQIQGLKNFLYKEYPKLITVDVVCRGVPSPLVLKKYLQFQKKNLGINNIEKLIFRDKEKYGYKYSTMTIKGQDKKYQQGVETDSYLRAFFENYSDRPSCYNCKFRDKDRISDFTIWDCFTIENFSKELDDNMGTTRMLIHTELARNIFEEIKEEFKYTEIPVEQAIRNVRELKNSPIPNANREKFFDDINVLEVEQFFNKYFPDSFKVKLERNIRKILVKTKFYNKIKNMIKKIIKKG